MEAMIMSTACYCRIQFHSIHINDTPFELNIFWLSNTKRYIKLTLSESVSLSLKTRLMTFLMMTLLNMPQGTSIVPASLRLNLKFFWGKGIPYNKQIINTVIWSDALYNVSLILLDITHHNRRSASRVILWPRNIHSTWCNASDHVTVVIL